MPKVFISLSEDDTGRLNEIMAGLTGLPCEFDFCAGPFMPIDSQEGLLLKRTIGEKIAKSNITLCLIGEHTHKSPWVDCQLRKSQQKGNKIIAMALKGTTTAVLPAVVREENLRFYPWNPKVLAKLLVD